MIKRAKYKRRYFHMLPMLAIAVLPMNSILDMSAIAVTVVSEGKEAYV